MDNINVVKIYFAQKKQNYMLGIKINVLRIVNSIIPININIMENVYKNVLMEHMTKTIFV